MTTTQQLPIVPIVGVVAKVSGNGFVLSGREGWINISKFARPDEAPLPAVGQTVAIVLDKAGFARKIAVAPTTTASAPAATTNGNGTNPTTAATDAATTSVPPARDTVITRLAVLNTSTAILSAGNRAVNPDDVLTLAARLEVWANR